MSETNETSLKYPTEVMLEACTLCQLNCPRCYMRLEDNCGLGKGYLSFENFKSFVALNPYVKEIELSNSGEIFLNPELDKIIKYAFLNGVILTATGGVNFNTVSDTVLRYLVKYKFKAISISIDGWDQDSYQTYRRNGNFNKVIQNIQQLNSYKKYYSTDTPELIWKYIIMEHTDNLIGAKEAQKIAKHLGMKFVFSQDWDGYIPKSINTPNLFCGWNIPCADLWTQPQINWDGKFLGCCVANYYTYDDVNLFKVPLKDYIQNKSVKDTKKMLMNNISSDTKINSGCEKCWAYLQMKKDDNFITLKELANGGRIIGT